VITYGFQVKGLKGLCQVNDGTEPKFAVAVIGQENITKQELLRVEATANDHAAAVKKSLYLSRKRPSESFHVVELVEEERNEVFSWSEQWQAKQDIEILGKLIEMLKQASTTAKSVDEVAAELKSKFFDLENKLKEYDYTIRRVNG
jgi:hypothetical protein